MAAIFPDAYMHIGGDENNGKHWDQSERIAAFKREKGLADNHALQAHFNRRVAALLAKHGKKMVGWEEILHPDLPKDIVIQSWQGTKPLAEAARRRAAHRTLVRPGRRERGTEAAGPGRDATLRHGRLNILLRRWTKPKLPAARSGRPSLPTCAERHAAPRRRGCMARSPRAWRHGSR